MNIYLVLITECGFSRHAAQYIIEYYRDLPCAMITLPMIWLQLRYELFIIPIQVDWDDTQVTWGWRCNSYMCMLVTAWSFRVSILSYSLHPLNASLLEKRTICRHLKGLFALSKTVISVKPPVFKYLSFQVPGCKYNGYVAGHSAVRLGTYIHGRWSRDHHVIWTGDPYGAGFNIDSVPCLDVHMTAHSQSINHCS